MTNRDSKAQQACEVEATWPELEAFLGEHVVGIIDRAIGKELSRHRNGMRPEDYYLHSEGLTHAVVTALRDAQIRVAPGLRAVR